MAAAIETTDGRHIINENSQDHGSSFVNYQSQQSANRVFEGNWFSPSLTSTQIVSFDLINSEDDTQNDFTLTQEKDNLLADLSLEEIPGPLDPSCLLTSSDHSVVSETPPPKGKPVDVDITNPINYLFRSTRLCSIEPSNSTPYPKMRAPTKRQATHTNKKKSSQMKKVKIEGYMCKLNGAVYHVVNRDLDVLEAIQKALNCIQQTICEQDMCSVRHLSLQLNQIETIIGILDDKQLELGMSLEAWNEVMMHTKKIFHDRRNEVDTIRRRRFQLDTSTDELTHSFSQSFCISSTKQGLPKKQDTSPNVENNRDKIPAKSIDSESTTLKTSEPVFVGQSENEIQTTQIPSNSITNHESVSLKTPLPQTMGRNGLLIGSKKNLKKKSSDVSFAPTALEGMHRLTSKKEERLHLITAEDRIRLSSDRLSLATGQNVVSVPSSTICYSRKTHAIGEDDSNIQHIDCFEALPEATISRAYVNESIPISDSTLGNVKPSNDIPGDRVFPAVDNCLPQIENEIAGIDERTVDVQEESFIIRASNTSSQSLFLWSTNRTPDIVKMSFHLRPFVKSGVLSPGKNNMKLSINSRIYVGSLAADGTIEMNGFNFPTIGNWIKSVEGKLFTKLSKFVQKTLDLQYDGKPLAQVIDVDEQPGSSIPVTVSEISSSNIASLSMSHSPMIESNLIQKQIPLSHPFVQSPMPYLLGANSNPIHKSAAIPNISAKAKEDLQLLPEEMTRHIKTIYVHTQDEYFPICKCDEQFWHGVQPFPKHILDEVDSWK